MASAVTAAGMLAATSAYACDPVVFKPSSQRVSLGNCAARIQYGEIDSAEISEAEDLGAGFVLQVMSDGSACGSAELEQVVQDCNSGRVAVFGKDYGPFWIVSPDDAPAASDMLIKQIRARIVAGRPLSIDEILAAAADHDITYQLETTTPSTLAINGHRFRIGCGCKTYYPDLPGPSG